MGLGKLGCFGGEVTRCLGLGLDLLVVPFEFPRRLELLLGLELVVWIVVGVDL